MRKILISLGLTALTVFLNPVIAYPQSKLSVQSLENNPTLLRDRINARIPLIITKGFEALENNETKEAFEIWLKSSIPLIRNNLAVMANTMQGVLDNIVGKCIGYYVIATFSLTDKTTIIYVESQHEEGAFFWRFTVHETPNKPVITSLEFNTNPSEVMPLPNLTDYKKLR